jgi:MinD superfamily P-loop ATPase
MTTHIVNGSVQLTKCKRELNTSDRFKVGDTVKFNSENQQGNQIYKVIEEQGEKTLKEIDDDDEVDEFELKGGKYHKNRKGYKSRKGHKKRKGYKSRKGRKNRKSYKSRKGRK